MIFKQTKENGVLSYEVEDIFGTITIRSDRELKPEQLDLIVVGVMRAGVPAGDITDTITYTFDRADDWLPEDEEEITTNTHETRDH